LSPKAVTVKHNSKCQADSCQCFTENVVFPQHFMKVYRGKWRIAPLILILGTLLSTLLPGCSTMPFLSRCFNQVSLRRPGIDHRPIHVLTYWHMKSLNITVQYLFKNNRCVRP